mmetsp:Transcript_91984/g.259888  ORF Transcript_91984/g.259888 Transcript_91984/m.259888 type:complete len:221 (+) Transcript_91984:298-960(+)
MGDARALRLVLSEDGAPETELRIVRKTDGVLLVLRLGDREDGPENLLVEGDHARLHVGQDRWCQETLPRVLGGRGNVYAAGKERGASLLRRLDHTRHLLFRAFVDHGAKVDSIRLGGQTLDHLLFELFLHALLNQNPLRRDAHLASVQDPAINHSFCSRLKVRVRQHHVAIRTAELDNRLLQERPCLRGHAAPDLRGACKGHAPYQRVLEHWVHLAAADH